MTNDRLQVGGAVVYWRLAPETSLPKLAAGLSDLALDKFTPSHERRCRASGECWQSCTFRQRRISATLSGQSAATRRALP